MHIDVPVHFRLHDDPHEPLQSFMFAQSSVQLVLHDELEMSHDWPEGQLHVEPVHLGGFPLLPPQPRKQANKPTMNSRIPS